ncbi:hypothetical protein K439DRAFT_1611287 [Ramaria rubella]|nr:hypothetical protein K439DRAFT_1611287 [Ramaria rubella]
MPVSLTLSITVPLLLILNVPFVLFLFLLPALAPLILPLQLLTLPLVPHAIPHMIETIPVPTIPFVTPETIIVEWRDGCLITKANRSLCINFNIRGTCTDLPSPSHGDHTCSLCGNPHHPASSCTWN